MRVVVDTNVIVAGLVASGLCHELIEDHLPRQEPTLSTPLWEELETTLTQKLGLELDELPFPPPLPRDRDVGRARRSR